MNRLYNNYRIMNNLHRAIIYNERHVRNYLHNKITLVEIHLIFFAVNVLVYVITCKSSANCFSCLFYVTLKISFNFMCESFYFIYRKFDFVLLIYNSKSDQQYSKMGTSSV